MHGEEELLADILDTTRAGEPIELEADGPGTIIGVDQWGQLYVLCVSDGVKRIVLVSEQL